MPRKEFVRLLEEIIMTLDRMGDRVRSSTLLFPLPRQQLEILVRLYGRSARLKDIARRESISAPNLCATFRKLERDGLVARHVDDTDRRNTWYRCTLAGDKMAAAAMEKFRDGIEKIFAGISRPNEDKLTGALKIMAQILRNMESKNNA